ncbi:MAG: sn-glycerol-3-phosphate ABC transporter ATP-binding protein UgpC [Chloroflexi bacterium]|nr:sn-glycerol-3-phosphate ABC transporter ATP-binding protein UgpC [Chloroflexota bacterium]
MARVVFDQVSKVFQGSQREEIHAVKSASLTVEEGELLVLVGPSGCGKSTLLRLLAGLEELSAGTIWIDGQPVNQVPPKDRDIAMVFQNYALYPHMNVYENMAFGLKLRKFPKAEIEQRVGEAAELLGLTPCLHRLPEALSGGLRQRVAVGRAIVRKPKVFLFDEPLSNLDAQMRVQTRMEIARLHTRLNSTMIYVTHDQAEAMTLGDRLAVMKEGVILQVADPLTLYQHPANLFVAGFIGSPPMNFFQGAIAGDGRRLWFAEPDQAGGQQQPRFRLAVSEPIAPKLLDRLGKPVILGLRPEDIAVASGLEEAGRADVAEARIEVVEPMGSETFLYLTAGAYSFVARVPADARPEVNQVVRLKFDLCRAHFFDPDTEKALD